MVSALKWQTLEERRAHMRMHMFHKIVNSAVDINHAIYLTPMQHDYNTRGAHIKYHYPQTRLHVYSNSFFPASIALWNNIDAGITAAADSEVFRDRLAGVRLIR